MKRSADLYQSAVQTAEAGPRLADDELYPEEIAYIQRAVPKRRAEFATGRVLARKAFAAMGIPSVPLPPLANRAPAWPSGIVGSVSHTDGYCAVVVGRMPPLRSIGLDVETLRLLDASVTALILTDREQARLRDQPRERRNDLALLIFSCKEAYYKCQHPISGGFLDFRDVELELDLTRETFEARVLKDRWPSSVARLSGRFAFQAGKVFSGLELLTV